MSWLDFRDIPPTIGNLSDLYIDYLTGFQNVKQYYAGDFRNPEDWKATLDQVSRKKRDRSILFRVLIEQNKNFHCSIKTLANIDLLHNDNTFAVVTGQQVGIFGGPLYTVYKILTELKLTEILKDRYPEYNFVPVFWLESEDHDFEEMNSITIIGQDNSPVRVSYLLGGKPLEKNPGPVGSLRFEEHLQDFFSSLDSALFSTEFKPKLIETLRHSYHMGATFTQSFVSWINKLFEDSGLVFCNINDREFKQLLTPMFLHECKRRSEISQLIITLSAELEQRYHAQVKPKAVNLFMFHKGGRYLIEPREQEQDFSLKGTRYYLSPDELTTAIQSTPELFSPNVILRPICQDTILPTAVYIGGPGEIAYFAQLKPVYELFDVPMPIIYPRASVTILEERLEKIIEKYQIDVADFFSDSDLLIRRISNQISEVKVDTIFPSTQQRISEVLTELQFGLTQIDPTLLGALEHTKQKIAAILDQLKSRTTSAQQRKNEIALSQIQKVANHLTPNGNFQERELSIVYFINKYGMEFTRWLNDEVKIDRFEHQILHL
jgi:bacillithiol biosynthesis cysteine-adding enzyme BshC